MLEGHRYDRADYEIDTTVVGAGQAGVAMSEHLTHHGIPHLVLEKSASLRPGAAAAGIRWWPTARPGTIGFPA